jgi:hypothetical protein
MAFLCGILRDLNDDLPIRLIQIQRCVECCCLFWEKLLEPFLMLKRTIRMNFEVLQLLIPHRNFFTLIFLATVQTPQNILDALYGAGWILSIESSRRNPL